jgi:5-deoxy-glucuronate isomerase
MKNSVNSGLKYSSRNGSGYLPVVSPENARLKMVEFGTVALSRGKRLKMPCGRREMCLLLLEGFCSAEVDGEKWMLGPRKDVFSDYPWALYLRNVSHVSVLARSKMEAVVSSVPSNSREPFLRLVAPQDVVERSVGKDTYLRRVRTVIGEDFPAEKLLLGETLNEAGKWSSYPPHRHEKDVPPHEAKLEEVYYYRTEKPSGFGVQRIYTDDGRIDKTYTVRQGDVCVLPRGYHPVSAAPCSKLYYFWVLAGKSRRMQWRVDPNFRQ